MAKPVKKKKEINQAADRFYDYLMAHRPQVLRYAVAALVTGLLQFFVSRMIPLESGVMIAYGVRFLLLFYVAKYWVYQEKGTGFFETARQMMIAVMVFMILTVVMNYLMLFLGNRTWISYSLMAVSEIATFLLYQFLIFKERD